MGPPSISKLQFYSLGLVSINKPLGSDIIEVTPVEDFPMLDGEITDNVEKYKSKTKDSYDVITIHEIDTTVTIKAKWLPISNSNRHTSPDVRRGEIVVIYKFADTDKYWWNTLFNDTKLRRLETVIYTFSDNVSEDVEDTPTSTYFLEVSTHRKLMHLHTSNSDGEPFIYDVQINAKDGIVTITDDDNNFIVLNSRDRRLTMHNGDDSIFDINKTNILLKCKDSITLESKNIISKASNNTNVTSGSETNIKSSVNNVSGPVFTDDSVTVTGLITGGAGLSISGGGGATVSGPINSTDIVTANQVISNQNIIAPNVD